MTFSGIPFAALDFYEDLEADNSKPFWLAHKHIYDEQVKVPLEALASELTPEFGPAKFFRPYRDVRFARDKTPYKDHQGLYFAESRRYLHISAAGLYVSGGMFHLESDQVQRYRRSVDEPLVGEALVKALKAAERGKLQIGGEQLTRIPAGFARDHPREAELRRKSVTASYEFGSPEWLKTARAKSEIVKVWRIMQPLIDWLDKHVGPAETRLDQRR
ncbi:DUF2461 domain-containing protein [Jatrophihabitans sp. DSM 45814]